MENRRAKFLGGGGRTGMYFADFSVGIISLFRRVCI